MAPPKFADIGKKAKDLFKKQYDYKNEFKVISKSGAKVETTATQVKGGIQGNVKGNFKDDLFGDVEIEAGSSTLKGQFKKGKVIDGLDITTSGSQDSVAVDTLYSKNMVTGTLKGTYKFSGATAVAASLSVGCDGVTLGGSADIKDGAVKDYNVGAQYATKGIIAALVTAKQGSDLTGSYFQGLGKDATVGASVTSKADNSRTFTVGGEYKLDKATTLKIKASEKGIVDAAVTHTLSNPALKFNFAAQFDAKAEVLSAQKYGVSFTVGDF